MTDQIEFILSIILILSIIFSITTQLITYRITKNVAIFGIVATRAFVLMLTILAIIYGHSVVGMQIIVVAYALLFVSSGISSIVEIYSYNIRQQIEYNGLLKLLKALKDKYSFIVENDFIAYVVFDFDGNIEFINEKFASLLGYSVSELLNKKIVNYIRFDYSKKLKKLMSSQEKLPNSKFSFGTCLVGKTGEQVCVSIFAFVSENGHRTITGVITEIPQETLERMD